MCVLIFWNIDYKHTVKTVTCSIIYLANIFDTLNIKHNRFEMKITEHCRRMFACDLGNSKHVELALFSC